MADPTNRPLMLSEGMSLAAAIAELGSILDRYSHTLPADQRQPMVDALHRVQERLENFVVDAERHSRHG